MRKNLNKELAARTLFTPSAPIHEASLFAGRSEQLERLVNAIAERGKHAVLYGERGVGKTSLTNTFNQIIGIGHIMPIRKQVSSQDNYTSLWKKIFGDIIYSRKEDWGYGKEEIIQFNADNLYPANISPDDVLRELERASQTLSPVIIFDEFDKLEDHSTKELMAHTIKAISDSGINSTIVIVGVADDITALIEAHESVKRNLEEIKMPRMSDDELKQILDERLPKLEMKIDPDAYWKIIVLSRGLPEYTHSLGKDSAINAIKQQRRQITEEDVDRAINTMLLESNHSSSQSYKKATHSNKKNALYKQVILACALAMTDDEGRFTPTAVIEPLTLILKNKPTIANFQSHLAAFCSEERGNILERRGSQRAYKYRFREPKMQPYVIMQGVSEGMVKNDALTTLSAPEQHRLFD